ncbi:MAG: hypothetical protein RR891_08120 [Clostridium sp.]|uniref:hypothetical protein n=1 Tax=Clostridium sp. TaxID=1506 RepID=UPI00306F906F
MNNRTLKTELYRVITSPLFWITFPLITVFSCLSCYEDLAKNLSGHDVTYIYEILFGLGAFKNMVILLAPMPYISTFCSDLNNNFIQDIIIRDGVKAYSKAKIVVNILVTFLVCFFGLMFFVVLLNLTMPLLSQSIDSQMLMDKPYGHILLGRTPILYFIIKSFLFSLSAAFWSTVGLYISSYIPNNFVAISAPFVSYYILGEIGEFLPPFFNFRLLAEGYNIINQNATITIIYTFIFYAILTMGVSGLFIKNIRRRIGNELI